jgi:hypothetical protein
MWTEDVARKGAMGNEYRIEVDKPGGNVYYSKLWMYCYRHLDGRAVYAVRSSAAHLLGLGLRIPPRVWMTVSCVLCYQVEVSAY